MARVATTDGVEEWHLAQQIAIILVLQEKRIEIKLTRVLVMLRHLSSGWTHVPLT